MTTREVFIDGIALWAPTLPGWDAARAAFRGEGICAEAPLRRPSAELLAPAERRRAPDTVALALEVGLRAIEASGHCAADLPSVFTSTHGDLGVTDYMCKTLVSTPTLVSPTKFHNSVHNATAGYWTMATACMQASTAISAYDCSFAAGLLEALVQCSAEERPVLLVGYDIEACGALASTTSSRGMLAAALVLSPQRGARSTATLSWSVQSTAALAPLALRSAAARSLAGNAMADCLPLFEALADGSSEPLVMPLSSSLFLQIAPNGLSH